MSNPLIQKWEEIHGKKEKPKVTKAEKAKVEYELKPELFQKQLAQIPATSIKTSLSTATSAVVAASNTGITKAPKLTSYDKHSANDAFLQIAEKVKNGTAQVSEVSLQSNGYGSYSYEKTITFVVYDYEC
jgi:hypothetical protein